MSIYLYFHKNRFLCFQIHYNFFLDIDISNCACRLLMLHICNSHCDTLQRTATRSNTLQHIAPHTYIHMLCYTHKCIDVISLGGSITDKCNTLQHTATRYRYQDVIGFGSSIGGICPCHPDATIACKLSNNQSHKVAKRLLWYAICICMWVCNTL